MKTFYLEDLAGLTEEQLRGHIVEQYEISRDFVDKFDIIIATEYTGPYGCDSYSFFLLKDKASEQLYEVHASHCSCYGFEGQFEPEETTKEYLLSNKFSYSLEYLKPVVKEIFGE